MLFPFRCWLCQAWWLLLRSIHHGRWIPRVRNVPQQDQEADGLQLQLACVSNRFGKGSRCSTFFHHSFSGQNPNYKSIAEHCNLWRNFDDIYDSWDSVLGIINYYGEDKDGFGQFAGPGRWNDPDMLIIGNYGLSLDQAWAQMGMWAMFARNKHKMTRAKNSCMYVVHDHS